MIVFVIASSVALAWLATMHWLATLAREAIDVQRRVWHLEHPGEDLPGRTGWIDLPRHDRHHRGDQ